MYNLRFLELYNELGQLMVKVLFLNVIFAYHFIRLMRKQIDKQKKIFKIHIFFFLYYTITIQYYRNRIVRLDNHCQRENNKIKVRQNIII